MEQPLFPLFLVVLEVWEEDKWQVIIFLLNEGSRRINEIYVHDDILQGAF